jgi:hypothetical protein
MRLSSLQSANYQSRQRELDEPLFHFCVVMIPTDDDISGLAFCEHILMRKSHLIAHATAACIYSTGSRRHGRQRP